MESGNSRDRVCPACQSRRSTADRFCGDCGEALATLNCDASPTDLDTIGARRWNELQPALVLWGLLLCTNGIFGLTYRFTQVDSPWLDLLMTLVGAVIILHCCNKDREQLASLGSLRSLISPRSLAAVPVFLGLLAFFVAYFAVFEWLGFRTISYLAPFQEHGWPLSAAFALVSVAPGIFEELAFRGQIMHRLERVLKPNDALIVQAAMFSVLHMHPTIFVSHFVFGLALGWLRRYSRSLYPGMFVHMAWNALVLALELNP